MRIKLILCDFDGVLYNFDHNNLQEGLYCDIKNSNKILHKQVKDFMFGNNKFIFYAWMRGYVNHNDLHLLIANKFNTSIEFLDEELIKSIKKFNLNWELINFLSNLKNNNLKVSICSDNHSAFTDIIVPYFKLNNFFDKIYSSSNSHLMKKNNDNQWVKEILIENNILPEEVLFIDDGEEIINNLKAIGFNTYLYNKNSKDYFFEWYKLNF